MNTHIRFRFIRMVIILAFAILASGCASSVTRVSAIPSVQATASTKSPLLEESVKSSGPETKPTYVDEISMKSPYPEEASPFADAVMKMDQDTYPASAATIQFTIEKRSEHEVMTGEPYSLEIYRDNAWYTVPFKPLAGNVVRAWSAVGILIPAQGVYSGSVHLTEHVPLTAGRYRLVKEILTQDRKDYWGNSSIWAEFTVTKEE